MQRESVPLSHEASAPELASADSAEPVRIGKDQVTVLVLNGCGIEGAAAEVAEEGQRRGFENVTVDNATYFNVRRRACRTTMREKQRGSRGAGRSAESGRACGACTATTATTGREGWN